MKKFLKLILPIAALATMFVFASCANGSSEDDDSEAFTVVTTKKITIDGNDYVYTTENGKVIESDKVSVADDGAVIITGADGSSVTVGDRGHKITYKDASATEYCGWIADGDESFTLKDSAGNTIEASLEAETNEPKMTVNVLAYTDSKLANKIFCGDYTYYTFKDGKRYETPDFEEAKTLKNVSGYTSEEYFYQYVFISFNDKIYKSQKLEREYGSGLSGLCTNFYIDNINFIYFKNNGKGALVYTGNGGWDEFKFKNVNGVVTCEASRGGQKDTHVYLYDGKYLYDLAEELTFEDSLDSSASVSDAAASLEIPTLAELAGKIFKKYSDGKLEMKYIFSANGVRAIDKSGNQSEPYCLESKCLIDSSYIRKSGTTFYMYDIHMLAGSNSGLFTTWWDNGNGSITLKSNGSVTLLRNASTYKGTFSNTDGLIVINIPGQVMKYIYDGEYLYHLEDMIN